MTGAVRLVCVRCGDAERFYSESLRRVHHWCWHDETTGAWCSMGWALGE